MLLLLILLHASVARAAPLDCDEIVDLVERGLPDVAVVSTIQAVGIAHDETEGGGVTACVTDANLSATVQQAVANARRIDVTATEAPPVERPPPTPEPPAPEPLSPAAAPVEATPARTPTASTGDEGAAPAIDVCDTLRQLVESRVAEVIIAETFTRMGLSLDDTRKRCPAISARTKSLQATSTPPDGPPAILPCLAEGTLSGAVLACNVQAGRIQRYASHPPKTPAEEDRRIAVQKSFQQICSHAESGAYAQAARCTQQVVGTLNKLARRSDAPATRRRQADEARVAATALADGLMLATDLGAWAADGKPVPSPLAIQAAAMRVHGADPSPKALAKQQARASDFRHAIFGGDWSRAASLVNEELRWGYHVGEAAVLARIAEGRAPRRSDLALLASDPWADMGVLRSRAWLPWLMAYDTQRHTCPAIPGAAGRKLKKMVQLAKTVPIAGDAARCAASTKRLQPATPGSATLQRYAQAAGLTEDGLSGPKDRLMSTSQMIFTRDEAQLEAALGAADAVEAALETAMGLLPAKLRKRWDAIQQKPATQCAAATVKVELLTKRVDQQRIVLEETRSYMEELGVTDAVLQSTLEALLDDAQDAVQAALVHRDQKCMGAAKKIGKSALGGT